MRSRFLLLVFLLLATCHLLLLATHVTRQRGGDLLTASDIDPSQLQQSQQHQQEGSSQLIQVVVDAYPSGAGGEVELFMTNERYQLLRQRQQREEYYHQQQSLHSAATPSSQTHALVAAAASANPSSNPKQTRQSHSTREFAAAIPTTPKQQPRSSSPPATPTPQPRVVKPTVSKASQYFPSHDPFNKHGLLRLRGVGYQPTPPGMTPLSSDAPDLYSQNFHHLHLRDLAALKKLGANTIRLWSFGGENIRGEVVDHTGFLNLCLKHGLFVILTFNPSQGYPQGAWSVPIEPPAKMSNDNATASSDNSEWSHLMHRFRLFLRRYQSHPAVTMWLVGNEPNLQGNKGKLAEWFRMMSAFAKVRDEECEASRWSRSWKVGLDGEEVDGDEEGKSRSEFPAVSSRTPLPSSRTSHSPYTPDPLLSNLSYTCWHPLSVPLSDSAMTSASSTSDLLNMLLPLETRYPTAVDIYSFQIYRGNTFGNFFKSYQTFLSKIHTKKRLLITEYGSDVQDFRMEEKGEKSVNETMQALSILSQYNELSSCPQSICLGGILFEYCDEWWKSSQYSLPAYLGCPLNQTESSVIHATCGWPGRTEDEFYSEAWFGMMGHDTEGRNDEMQCLKPREVFFRLMDWWKSEEEKWKDSGGDGDKIRAITMTGGENVQRRSKTTPTDITPSSSDHHPLLPLLDTSSRISEFCSSSSSSSRGHNSCCAYQDSSQDWLLGAGFLGVMLLCLAAYWMMNRWVERKGRDTKNGETEENVGKKKKKKSSAAAFVTTSSSISPSTSLILYNLSHHQLIQSHLASLLLTHFHACASSLRVASTSYHNATASYTHSHITLQRSLLLKDIMHQYSRTSSLPRAYIITHEKILLGYKTWCRFVGVTPNLGIYSRNDTKKQKKVVSTSYDIHDLIEYLLIWSISEQMRRVSSFVYERFHWRYECCEKIGEKKLIKATEVKEDKDQPPSDDKTSSILSSTYRHTHSFSISSVPLTQKAIDEYLIDYDDLEDLCNVKMKSEFDGGGEKTSTASTSAATLHPHKKSSSPTFTRLLLTLSTLYSNAHTPFSLPSSISWFTLVLQFYSLLTFLLLLFYLTLDVVSSSIIVSLGKDDVSLRPFWMYFKKESDVMESGGMYGEESAASATSPYISSTGLATFLRLASLDALLLLIYQPLSLLLTYSYPKFRHILLFIVALKSLCMMRYYDFVLIEMAAPFLASVKVPKMDIVAIWKTNEYGRHGASSAASDEISPASFALLYLTLRLLLWFLSTVYSIFRLRNTQSGTILPGKGWFSVETRRDLSYVEYVKCEDTSKEEKLKKERELWSKIEGLQEMRDMIEVDPPHPAVPAGDASSSSTAASTPPPPVSTLLSAHKPSSTFRPFLHSIWYILRLLMFWSLTLQLKLLFDTYVLLPSVAGITVQSLCHTPFEHGRNVGQIWIASTVDSPLKTRHELVVENLQSSDSTIIGGGGTSMKDHFLQHYSCPSLVYILWFITILISFASTYISYMITLSLFGFLIPSYFSTSSFWNRMIFSVWMMLFWCALTMSLAVGAVKTAGATILLFGVVHLIVSDVVKSNGTMSTGSNSGSIKSHVGRMKDEGARAYGEKGGDDDRESSGDDGEEEEKKDEAIKNKGDEKNSNISKSSTLLPKPPSLLLGLQSLLQILFSTPLTIHQTLLTWNTLVECMYKEDLVSKAEKDGVMLLTLDPVTCGRFLSLSNPLQSSHVRERINFFLTSLYELRRKHSAYSSTNIDSNSSSFSPRFPFSIQQQKSHTILIPLYNETVFYTLNELLAEQTATSSSCSTASSSNICRHSITLLEFLVSKHPDEWNNFIARLCDREDGGKEMKEWLVRQMRDDGDDNLVRASAIMSNGITALANTALDALLFLSSPSTTAITEPLSTLIRELLLWASYRGQTLSRTVRGMLYSREALEMMMKYEVAGDRAASLSNKAEQQVINELVSSKFQLLIAAQVYGLRVSGKTNRRQMQELMQLHAGSEKDVDPTSSSSSASASLSSTHTHLSPVEVVYNYDARQDIEDCTELRRKFIKNATAANDTTNLNKNLQIMSAQLCDLREPLAPWQSVKSVPYAPASVQSSATAPQQLQSSLTSLQQKLLRFTQSSSRLRALSNPLAASSSIPTVPTSLANISSTTPSILDAADVAAVLQLFSPKVAIAMDKLDSMEQGRSGGEGATASSSYSPSPTKLTLEDELLLHSATQQCWCDALKYVRYEVCAMIQQSDAEAYPLFVTFIKYIDVYLTQDQDILERLNSSASAPKDTINLLQTLQNTVATITLEFPSAGSLKRSHVINDSAVMDSSNATALHQPDITIHTFLYDLLFLIYQQHQQQMQSYLAFLLKLFQTKVDSTSATTQFATPQILTFINSHFTHYIHLLQYPFSSVHCTYSSSTGQIQILNSLPRHSNLLLGSISGLKKGSVPAPQTSAKSENQLHALIFSSGSVIQTIDMNQDFTFENALKLPWSFTEFQSDPVTDEARFVLIGVREVIYTHNISTVGSYMSYQDLSFVTIVQRVLHYTNSRLHYGHPDLFLREYVQWRGVGVSKASREKNLSEDLFFGTDALLRGYSSSHVEYLRYGKGREVSLTTCSIFEDKLARGAAQILRTSDLWRISTQVDSLTSLSVLFGSILHYLYTLLFDYTITSYVWIILLMRLTQIDSERIGVLGSVYAIPWLFHLGYIFGLPLLTELVYEYGLLWGMMKFIQNLLFGSIYYLFQLRTKSTGIQSGFHGGSAKYRGTGRSFGLQACSLLEMYQQYGRTHYGHALQLLSLLSLYTVLLTDEPAHVIFLKSYAVLLACFSWLLAPVLFNPTIRLNEGSESRWKDIVEEKKGELRQVWKWIETRNDGESNASTSSSWEQWMWEDHFSLLQLRSIRIYTSHLSSSGRLRTFINHPLAITIWELVMKLVEWIPWLFLAIALLISSFPYLPTFLLYSLLLLLVYLLPIPRSLQFGFLITCVLVYFTSVHMEEQTEGGMMRHRTSSPFILAFSSIAPLFSLLLSFFLLHLIACDLFLHSWIDFKVVKGVMKQLGWEKNKSTTPTTTASSPSPLYTSRTPPSYYFLICHHPAFFSWQLVYRYFAPLLVSTSHFIAAVLINFMSRWHTSGCYGIDLKQLTQQHVRRQKVNKGRTGGDANNRKHLKNAAGEVAIEQKS